MAQTLHRVVWSGVFASILTLDIYCATLHIKCRLSKKKQQYGTVGGVKTSGYVVCDGRVYFILLIYKALSDP